MDQTPITKRSFNLKNLFFDPNNYRFIDEKDYKKVAREDILNERVQKKTKAFIEGNKRSNISDLITSFKANGYIPVEKIQVKDLGGNQYLVLEGNRRTAALKALQEDYDEGKDIGKLDPSIFKKVDVEVHDEENEQTHLLVMGLKHIGGNKKWPAVNQAKFIKDYIEKFHGDYWEAENSACETLNISKMKLRQALRALELIEQYKLSDYGDQFENEQYSIFEEIVRSPNVKEWIGWNDDDYIAENNINLERLFSWISTIEIPDDENDTERRMKQRIITKSAEIRDLKTILTEEPALEIMEITRSLNKGLLASSRREQINLQVALDSIKDNIGYLGTYKNLFDIDSKKDIEQIYKNLLEFLPQKTTIEIDGEYNTTVCFEIATSQHFSKIKIEQYKIFKNFIIDKFNKINIFAGLNNTGKTSLLEAVYLLTKQNDLNAFFEMVRLKNKFDKLSPLWINKTLNSSPIKLQGSYNNVEARVNIYKYEANNIDKAGYVTSIAIESSIDDGKNISRVDLYEYTPLKLYYENIKILCNSMFKSPFFYKESDLLLSHKKSVEKNVIKQVIEFLKTVDSNLEDIDLTEEYGIKRFLVESASFKEGRVDITNYGEGLQRIFEISLAFAYAKNGVILIDELETGIHHLLLVNFTKFIQELAEQFNVQVFITSHSRECINAFINNGFRNEEISAYHLKNIDGQIKYEYSDGNRLTRLVENMDFDIRGNK